MEPAKTRAEIIIEREASAEPVGSQPESIIPVPVPAPNEDVIDVPIISNVPTPSVSVDNLLTAPAVGAVETTKNINQLDASMPAEDLLDVEKFVIEKVASKEREVRAFKIDAVFAQDIATNDEQKK